MTLDQKRLVISSLAVLFLLSLVLVQWSRLAHHGGVDPHLPQIVQHRRHSQFT